MTKLDSQAKMMIIQRMGTNSMCVIHAPSQFVGLAGKIQLNATNVKKITAPIAKLVRCVRVIIVVVSGALHASMTMQLVKNALPQFAKTVLLNVSTAMINIVMTAYMKRVKNGVGWGYVKHAMLVTIPPRYLWDHAETVEMSFAPIAGIRSAVKTGKMLAKDALHSSLKRLRLNLYLRYKSCILRMRGCVKRTKS